MYLLICVCLCIVVSNTYGIVFFLLLRLVYRLLSVSLDCPFLIAPSVFSNAYLPLSTIILLKFETVPKVWYFLLLFYP